MEYEIAAAADGGHFFDIVIVGSGYGGAVAADRLSACEDGAGRKLRIAVLERGREYLAGAFPSTLGEIAGHVRFTTANGGAARGRLEGLFDARLGSDVSVVVANGVGGGSLINAGVLLQPNREIFEGPAWAGSISHDDLRDSFDRLKVELGATLSPCSEHPNEIDATTFGVPIKRMARMESLDGGACRAVPISVALHDRVTCAGVELAKCKACGDCATGCNHAAKNSLDVNLLRRASLRGVDIYAGATVSRIRRQSGVWELDTWHTDLALRRRMRDAVRVRAKRVILAAGTLGTTEILLRSRTESLKFSQLLGSRFSGNGDVLASIFACDESHEFNAVACEEHQPSTRYVGPTITSMVDWRTTTREEANGGFVIQDLAVPAPLRRFFEETTATSSMLHQLLKADPDAHGPDDAEVDPCAVDPRKVERSAVVAIIGRDTASGVMHPIQARELSDVDAGLEVDPGVRIVWPDARRDNRLDEWHELLAGRVKQRLGGQLLPNPAWRLVPKAFEGTLGTDRGPLLTVHPLGGCPLGPDRDHGVVDRCGRVFDGGAANRSEVHDGLVVLDGSIVPASLGINPALTIAALADRAIRELIDNGWKLRRSDGRSALTVQPTPRPRFVPDCDIARPVRQTKVQVVEQLTGWVELGGRRRFVELSLVYEPTRLSPRGAKLNGRTLNVKVDPDLSRLRVFPAMPLPEGWLPPKNPIERKFEERRNDDAILVAPIATGSSLRYMQREASDGRQRRCRALRAWIANRATRDLVSSLAERVAGLSDAGTGVPSLWRQAKSLASHAGQVRLFDYSLVLGTPTIAKQEFAGWAAGKRITGTKRLTYARRSSPWAQLMRLTLDEFGGVVLGRARRIDVNPVYFARNRVPLLRITEQHDQPNAFADLASFALYVARILIQVHLWSFRKPDRPLAREPRRLPGALPGLPAPEVHELEPGDDRPGVIRLTRYPNPGGKRPPVLMVHGYFLNGTMFAHPALRPGLAEYLWHRGAEPWVLDLRTSSGMPTARHPWTFEQIAEADIPAAVRFVCRTTGKEQIDVVTHCMGSAMFAMALLSPDSSVSAIIGQVRRWVMSQIGPAMYLSPSNILRAYLMQYVRNLLPGLEYSVSGPTGTAGVDADLFDRLLHSMPYLGEGADSEFDVENPSWLRPWRTTPWVRTRHRVDALTGRDFDARRVTPDVLNHLDDFFGDISLATISQTIHFARNAFVTPVDGSESYLERDRAKQVLAKLPILSLHAMDSDVADWETGLRVRADLLTGSGKDSNPKAQYFSNAGHLDLMIGKDSERVFRSILDFFGVGSHE